MNNCRPAAERPQQKFKKLLDRKEFESAEFAVAPHNTNEESEKSEHHGHAHGPDAHGSIYNMLGVNAPAQCVELA
jgi:hypothetical protein